MKNIHIFAMSFMANIRKNNIIRLFFDEKCKNDALFD